MQAQIVDQKTTFHLSTSCREKMAPSDQEKLPSLCRQSSGYMERLDAECRQRQALSKSPRQGQETSTYTRNPKKTSKMQ